MILGKAGTGKTTVHEILRKALISIFKNGDGDRD